jgi:hypothetical protein
MVALKPKTAGFRKDNGFRREIRGGVMVYPADEQGMIKPRDSVENLQAALNLHLAGRPDLHQDYPAYQRWVQRKTMLQFDLDVAMAQEVQGWKTIFEAPEPAKEAKPLLQTPKAIASRAYEARKKAGISLRRPASELTPKELERRRKDKERAAAKRAALKEKKGDAA